MAPRPRPRRREEILDQVVAYLVANGVTNASLRDLANGLGVSTYTFSYQFGTKEELLVAILQHLRKKQDEAVMKILQPGMDIIEGTRRYWHWAVEPGNIHHVALTYEVARFRGLPAEQRSRVLGDWVAALNVGFAAAGISEERAPLFSSMMASTVGGLLMDLAWSDERERIQGAFDLFLEMITDRIAADRAGAPADALA